MHCKLLLIWCSILSAWIIVRFFSYCWICVLIEHSYFLLTWLSTQWKVACYILALPFQRLPLLDKLSLIALLLDIFIVVIDNLYHWTEPITQERLYIIGLGFIYMSLLRAILCFLLYISYLLLLSNIVFWIQGLWGGTLVRLSFKLSWSF